VIVVAEHTAEKDAAYREQAEATIADLRARVSHYEALLAAVREETLTKAALAVDYLFINVRGFDESWDRGYRRGVQDAAYAVRELRATSHPTPPQETEGGAPDDRA
jgi:transposase